MFVVFDLDGTLALTEHRDHILTAGLKKDWRSFYTACGGDAPCHPLIRTALAFVAAGGRVEIWTGRSDEVLDQTRAWMAEHGLGALTLRMRLAGDHRPDTDLKRIWMARKTDLAVSPSYRDHTLGDRSDIVLRMAHLPLQNPVDRCSDLFEALLPR